MPDRVGLSVVPTYAPNPPLVTPEVCQWSDAGGRYLLLRLLPSGELDLTFRGEGEDDLQTFRVASPDAPNLARTFVPWLQVLQRRSSCQRITHGRHCTCRPCRVEDWTNPDLAPCGMHGSDCPALYQPWGPAGTYFDPKEAQT